MHGLELTFVSFSKMFRMSRFCCLYFFLSFYIIQRISRQFHKTYLMYYVLIQQALWAHCTSITFDLPLTIYLVCWEMTYTCIHAFAKNSIFNSSECIHLYMLVYGKYFFCFKIHVRRKTSNNINADLVNFDLLIIMSMLLFTP